MDDTPQEPGDDGLAPKPLRQATELTKANVHALIGEPASKDPDVRLRLAEVVWLVYCRDEPASLASIARSYGVTTERVRQLHNHGIRLMRPSDRRGKVLGAVRSDTRLWHAIMHGCTSQPASDPS